MYSSQTKKLRLIDLKKHDVVWSEYFKCYLMFEEREEDGDYLFRFLHNSGWAILQYDNIVEPPSLIKELF